MKPGRNDPCPCGSGKKYKHCHLQIEEAPRPEEIAWRRLRRAIDSLIGRLLNVADAHFGGVAVDEAWDEFNLWDLDEPFDPESPHVGVFMSWFVYDWLPDPRNTELPEFTHTTTVAQAYLETAGPRLDPLVRRYVEACCAAPFSFHEIIACEPGHGFRLRDILVGSELDVIEQSASTGVQVGDLLYAKVVAVDGIAVVDACTPVLFPPSCKPEILELRAKLPAERGPWCSGIVREHDLELRDIYLRIAESLLYPEMPEMANTDGDPIEFHELVYDLDSPASAFQALKPLASGMAEEDIQQGAVFDTAGELLSADIIWQRSGNSMQGAWEKTTLGVLKIEGRRLTAQLNSAKRAEDLRKLIGGLAGSHVRYRTTVIQSLHSVLSREQTPQERQAARRSQEESARLAAQPEVQAALADMLRTHYRKWVDEKIPALGNRTPRESMRDRDGREAVEALVLQLERDGLRMQPPLDLDILRELRETLGLTIGR